MKTRPHPSTKPYFPCLSCPDFGKTCAGKSTRQMPTKEWCEYMRDVKECRKAKGDFITNQQIAEQADASLSTIERIMAISIDKDINRDIARRIEIAIIGTDAEKPCYREYNDTALLERIAALEKEVQDWKHENELKNKVLERLLQ